MSALQDEDTQRKGVVIVLMNVGQRRYFFDNLSIMKYSQRFSLSMPHYISALHYVYDDILLYPLVTFSRFLLGSRVRGRFLPHLVRKYCTLKNVVGMGCHPINKDNPPSLTISFFLLHMGVFFLHIGSQTECVYKLQMYGIPTQFLPVDESWNVRLENHLDWLERRKVQEESGVQATAVVPRRFDVLLGRGKTISEHTGNLRAFHIVEMNREKYEKASRFQKTQIGKL